MKTTEEMLKELDRPVPPWDASKEGGYWHISHEAAIAKANDIFGIWSYNTREVKSDPPEYYESITRDKKTKEMVRYTSHAIVDTETALGNRSGTGSGTMSGPKSTASTVLENSRKSAETNALKRSLVNFGYALGLCLYNKKYIIALQGDEWMLFDPHQLEKMARDPEKYAGGLKTAEELCKSRFRKYAGPILASKGDELPETRQTRHGGAGGEYKDLEEDIQDLMKAVGEFDSERVISWEAILENQNTLDNMTECRDDLMQACNDRTMGAEG